MNKVMDYPVGTLLFPRHPYEKIPPVHLNKEMKKHNCLFRMPQEGPTPYCLLDIFLRTSHLNAYVRMFIVALTMSWKILSANGRGDTLLSPRHLS